MTRQRRGFAVALLSALTFSPAAMARDDGQDLGMGQNLCAQFSKAYAESPGSEDAYWSWATGMMSGLNFASVANSGVFRDLSGDQDIFRRAIRLYCDRHPLTTFSGAVLDLYVSMPLKKANSK
jgi:hypothetical protein